MAGVLQAQLIASLGRMCQVILFGSAFATAHLLYFLGCNFSGSFFVTASLDLCFLQFVKPLFVYLIFFVQHDDAPNGLVILEGTKISHCRIGSTARELLFRSPTGQVNPNSRGDLNKRQTFKLRPRLREFATCPGENNLSRRHFDRPQSLLPVCRTVSTMLVMTITL